MDSNNNEKVLELNALDLIAIAIRDLRKINIPVEFTEQIAVPICNSTNVLNYALQQIQNANKQKEQNNETITESQDAVNSVKEAEEQDHLEIEEVNQNGTK